MASEIKEPSKITVENAPAIPGLSFRGFRGEDDYANMLEIINKVKIVDETERSDTLEDIRRSYSHLERSDPYQDILFVEVDGKAVGYSRGMWDEEQNKDRLYSHFVILAPEWRDKGIGRAVSGWMQNRLMEIAKDHPADAPKYFQVWTSETEKWNQKLFLQDGFEAARVEIEMTRPCSEEIKVTLLPEGVEVRPSKPEFYRQIFDSSQEAFQDHWGYVAPTEETYKSFLDRPTFEPELWKVAWEGDEVVGCVLNFIDRQQNEEYDRLRGYTEYITTRRPWRKKGIARALLTQSIKMFQDMGMQETALGVDSENPNQALGLYTSVGYKEVKKFTTYRKKFKL